MDLAQENTAIATSSSPEQETSLMAFLLKLVGWVSLVAGVIGFVVFLPGEPEYGYSWKAGAYIPAISCLAAGIFQGLVFGALGTIISYLEQISKNGKASSGSAAGA